jgi:hypothetical protein
MQAKWVASWLRLDNWLVDEITYHHYYCLRFAHQQKMVVGHGGGQRTSNGGHILSTEMMN